jgi:glucuronoarabinoxylan endo-1,4-beta-xylanase
MKRYRMVRRVGILVLLCIMLLSLAGSVYFSRQRAYAASAVTINGGTTYQTIDGFGFSEAFGQASSLENAPSSQRQQALNDLFSTSSGAGFTILRNLLPSDSGNTIEPNSPGSPSATPSYRALGDSEGQVWMSQQAKSYGVPYLYGDAWSAPGFMKTNGNEANGGAVCGTPGASCSSGDWRQAYANYLTQYAKDYAAAGVPLTQIGAFNEPDFTASYSSMNMNPTQTADMIRFLKPTLAAAGLNPQVVCCDPTGWGQAQNYANGVTSNSSANANVDMFSSHGYSGAPASPLNGVGSRHVWETEWSTFESQDNAWDDGTDASGLTWAQHIYTGLTAANLNGFLYWWGAVGSGTTDNEGLLQLASNGSVVTTGRLWAFANYSRFIRPGAVRIGASSGDSNLQVSAYKNSNGVVAIVVLNTASSAITASYSLQNTGVADGTTVTPYLTNSSNNTAQQGPTSVSGGSFSATIPARSLVTYVLSGSGGGSPTPTPTPGGTTYYHLVNRNSGLVMDVSGASTSAGANVIQWPNNGGFNQEWSLQPAGNGYYYLVNRNSGLVMDVSGASTSQGANVIQWSNHGGTNQQWSLQSTGDGYYRLVNRNSGLVADVNGASTSQGAQVIQWPNNGGFNQEWSLVQV